MGRLHREHPEVELGYEVANSSRIEQQLLRNELDLGFVGGPVQSAELETERLAEDHIVCITAPDHPLARKRNTRPEELVREICVTREVGSATRQLFESWLMGAGLRLERTLVVAGPQAAMTLVAAGLGFSFVSRHALKKRTVGVTELAIAGLRIARPITAVWHRSKHFHQPMRRLLELVRIECNKAS